MITLQYIAIAIIIAIAVAWIIRRTIRIIRKPASACDGCELASNCRKKHKKSPCHTDKNTHCHCR